MNNDEKIRLVLETLGVDNVRQANKELRELSKSLDRTQTAAGSATGKKGAAGQGILQLAFAIDDLQYGIRGIVNNIPQVVQALGLGAGFAGAAGIAAVALNQLVAKYPEWFEWSEKVKTKLGELNDVIKAEEAAIKRQKEAVDKLAESNSTRIEDIQKLKSMTEDLQTAEDQLDKDRKNRKAAEDAAKNQGVAADEELAFQKDIAKQLFTDTGMEGELFKEIAKQVSQSIPEVDAKGIRDSFFETFGGTMPEQDIERLATQRIGKLTNERDSEIRSSAEALFGGIMKPKDQAELDDAMGNLSKLAPQLAETIKRYYDVEKRAEEADKALSESIEGIRESTAKRKRDAAEANRQLDSGMRFGPDRGVLNAAVQAREFAAMGENQNQAEANAAARNATLAQFDPAQLAAMRLLQSGGSVRGTRQLERRDRAVFGNALMQRGMAPGAAAEATDQSIEGGERQLMEFAESINAPMKSAADFMRVATIYLQKVGMNAMQIQEQMNAMQMQMNMLSNGQQAPMQPQHLRANK